MRWGLPDIGTVGTVCFDRSEYEYPKCLAPEGLRIRSGALLIVAESGDSSSIRWTIRENGQIEAYKITSYSPDGLQSFGNYTNFCITASPTSPFMVLEECVSDVGTASQLFSVVSPQLFQ